ncbi:adenylyl-sulfate kinase [Methylobacterium sp. B4]|uniref:adenylyl-sulfate kinase n=1 Tax=Methylobacterium sp. B4 TaxID=1938755 RepID=UPI0032AEDB27
MYDDTPLALCEARDPKGLNARARTGTISDFTGISPPYGAPEALDRTTDHRRIADPLRVGFPRLARG